MLPQARKGNHGSGLVLGSAVALFILLTGVVGLIVTGENGIPGGKKGGGKAPEGEQSSPREVPGIMGPDRDPSVDQVDPEIARDRRKGRPGGN